MDKKHWDIEIKKNILIFAPRKSSRLSIFSMHFQFPSQTHNIHLILTSVTFQKDKEKEAEERSQALNMISDTHKHAERVKPIRAA